MTRDEWAPGLRVSWRDVELTPESTMGVLTDTPPFLIDQTLVVEVRWDAQARLFHNTAAFVVVQENLFVAWVRQVREKNQRERNQERNRNAKLYREDQSAHSPA